MAHGIQAWLLGPLTASLFMLAACSDPAADAKAAGYNLAPAGGEVVTGHRWVNARKHLFQATVPEGWFWRESKRRDGADFVIVVYAPSTDVEILKTEAFSKEAGHCRFAIKNPFPVRTQDEINTRVRDLVSNFGKDWEPQNERQSGYKGAEVVEDSGRAGFFATFAEKSFGGKNLDVKARMVWDTPDVNATGECTVQRPFEGAPLKDDPTVAAMIAMVRSLRVVPP